MSDIRRDGDELSISHTDPDSTERTVKGSRRLGWGSRYNLQIGMGSDRYGINLDHAEASALRDALNVFLSPVIQEDPV